jgi:hypothetical protein
VQRYPNAPEIVITADAGGSNGYRSHVRKYELRRLADKLDIAIRVSHFPPGTSKWNKVEHRLFSFISINWRGRPLRSHETIVSLISNTTNRGGSSSGPDSIAGSTPSRRNGSYTREPYRSTPADACTRYACRSPAGAARGSRPRWARVRRSRDGGSWSQQGGDATVIWFSASLSTTSGDVDSFHGKRRQGEGTTP